MKLKPCVFAAVLLLLVSGRAEAADFAVIGQIPVILNMVILAGAIACLAVTIKLFALVKGGSLAKGWQLWVASFFALAFGQIFILAEKLDVFAVGFDLSGILYLATVVLWFMGLLQTRKVLG
jgi:hypothetical protein